jgi:hypothetical protein
MHNAAPGHPQPTPPAFPARRAARSCSSSMAAGTATMMVAGSGRFTRRPPRPAAMLLLPTSNVDHESDSGYCHQLAAMLQLEKVRFAQLALNCGLSAEG